jgi:hypothetical protein
MLDAAHTRVRGWITWAYAVRGPDRTVLTAGVAARAAGIAALAYQTLLMWDEFVRPVWAAALALAAVAESLGVIGWWLARQRLDRITAMTDAAFGLGLVLVGRATNVGLVLTYTVLVSFTLGLAWRRLFTPVAIGLVWAMASVAPLGTGSPELGWSLALLLSVPSYLVNPLIGALCARLLRRMTADLQAASADEAAHAAAVATAQERARHARALHDRVLQTMETLARGSTVPDDAMRARIVTQAAWLRAYVETGRVDQGDDLATGLAAASQAVADGGARVHLNDAALRAAEIAGDGSAGLDHRRRDALIDATHHAMAAMAGTGGRVVVHAAPQSDGVLVTVLGHEGAAGPGEDGLAHISARLATVGGHVVAEALPYLELWVPTGLPGVVPASVS